MRDYEPPPRSPERIVRVGMASSEVASYGGLHGDCNTNCSAGFTTVICTAGASYVATDDITINAAAGKVICANGGFYRIRGEVSAEEKSGNTEPFDVRVCVAGVPVGRAMRSLSTYYSSGLKAPGYAGVTVLAEVAANGEITVECNGNVDAKLLSITVSRLPGT